jgi:hypothetical protein
MDTLQDIWHTGSDFGIPRTPTEATVQKYVGVTPTIQKKITALEQKYQRVLTKWSQDKSLEVSVKKGTMMKVEKVRASEALQLLDKAIDTWRRTRNWGGGIIVYI